jgi:hypothetical protein
MTGFGNDAGPDVRINSNSGRFSVQVSCDRGISRQQIIGLATERTPNPTNQLGGLQSIEAGGKFGMRETVSLPFRTRHADRDLHISRFR